MMDMMNRMTGSDMGWGMAFINPVIWFMLIVGFLGILGFFLYLMTNKNRSKDKSLFPLTSSHGHSIEILNERYARGDINDEDYARRKKVLSSN
jgi:uncharacterized membrane protein